MENSIEPNSKFAIPSKKKAIPLASRLAIAATIWQMLTPHVAVAAAEASSPELLAPALASHPVLQELRWQAEADEAEGAIEVPVAKLPQAGPAKPRQTLKMSISAYTSDVAQTDDDPCTTASGLDVCERNAEDIVATNYRRLPFGTAVRIPELFGDRVFYVHDRMNKRYTATVDVWMRDIADARKFGRRVATVEIF